MNQLRDNLKTLGLSPNHIFQQVKDAISEDLAGGEDITSISTISETQVSTAEFTSRSAGVVSGLHIVAAVLEYCGINHYEVLVDEGSKVTAGKVLIRAQGNTQKLLLAERTALNFLSHLSGISTLVNTWVEEIAGTKCQIRDTRKTTPGLILSTGSITAAYKAIRKAYPNKSIEIEVDSLEQFTEALTLKPDLILLDNMSVEMCLQAVEQNKGLVKLEASGGLSLKNAKAYANTGVDYLAVGALTHSAPALDIGLDFRKDK